MQKVLSLIVLGVLAISAIGQAEQPPKSRPGAKSTQKKSSITATKGTAAVKMPEASDTSSQKTTAVNAAETPEPSPPPVDPEMGGKRFEAAIAAPTAAEKARLLRIFLDKFPESTYAVEAVEY